MVFICCMGSTGCIKVVRRKIRKTEKFEADGQRVVELYEKAMKGKLRKDWCRNTRQIVSQRGSGVSIVKELAAQLLVDICGVEDDMMKARDVVDASKKNIDSCR